MKYRFIVIFTSLFFTLSAQAQEDSVPLAPYLKTRQVPGFKLLLTDSATYFYKYQLKKSTPSIIIFFNPECDHCQTEAKHISDSIQLLQKVQIVFASSAPLADIKKFADEYGLLSHPNIKVGRDEKYFLSTFYRLRYAPFVAVYDEKGDLMKVFEGGTTIKILSQLF
jgi:cytochrome oxidase Cu insertion factor (SCO1/SenC/PrrC family)